MIFKPVVRRQAGRVIQLRANALTLGQSRHGGIRTHDQLREGCHSFPSLSLLFQQTFPLEVHLVLFNPKKGKDVKAAAKGAKGAQDALVVLSVLMDLGQKENEALKRLFHGILYANVCFSLIKTQICPK